MRYGEVRIGQMKLHSTSRRCWLLEVGEDIPHNGLPCRFLLVITITCSNTVTWCTPPSASCRTSFDGTRGDRLVLTDSFRISLGI
jgi:hypothetical protein